MHEARLAKLKENIDFLRKQIKTLRENQDYIVEKRTRKI
jgi:cell division protein FtsB